MNAEDRMMIPCRDHCYLRYGKEYTSDCDTTCDYARVVKENEALKLQVEELRKQVNQEV